MSNNFMGMFGAGAENAQRQQQDDALRARAAAASRMTPQESMVNNRVVGAGMLGQGVNDLVRAGVGAATGTDTRNQDQRVQAVRRQLQEMGIDPSDVEKFYPALIRILQQNGMLPEAMAAAREFEEIKNTREGRAIQNKAITSREAMAAARLAVMDPRSPLSKSITDLQELMGKRDAAPEGSQARKNLDVAVERMSDAISKAQKGAIKIVDAGGTLQIVDAETGMPIREVAKTNDPNAKNGGGNGKPPPPKMLADWGAVASDIQGLVELAGTFKPSFSGTVSQAIGTATGWDDLLEKLRVVTAADPAASAWWNQYADLVVKIRHQLFGATLTGGEQNAFNSVRALAGQPAAGVLQRLKSQANGGLRNMKSEVNAVASSYDTREWEQRMTSLDPAVANMPTAPGSAAAPAQRVVGGAPSGGGKVVDFGSLK